MSDDEAPDTPTRSQRVLVVEDEVDQRLLIGHLLEKDGFPVGYAIDGEDAMKKLDQESFQLIVTDLAMPNVSGLRLIRELREGGDSIPIVAISGKNADQLHLAEDYGANVILFKPIEKETLLEAVRRLAEEHASTWNDVFIVGDQSWLK